MGRPRGQKVLKASVTKYTYALSDIPISLAAIEDNVI